MIMNERMISNIVISMREFQEKNCIRKQCVTNTQYLYDCIKMNTLSDVKVKPVIVLSTDKETSTFTMISGHLVVVLLDDNETIIDPSYDVFILQNKSYFDNIKDLMDNCDNETRQFVKKGISDFINFITLAERINNGECVICDKEFYNRQADYIENQYSK